MAVIAKWKCIYIFCDSNLIMAYGYSDDLPQAVLKYYDSENITQKQVCAIFDISWKTFSNWIRLKKQRVDSRRLNQRQKEGNKNKRTSLGSFADFQKPKIQVWENVTFADNYYQ